MKAVIQRVKKSSCTIDNKLFSEISRGFTVLLGVEKNDTEQELIYVADKLLKLRVFEDENLKMNYSIKDINGEILVISQFTLAGSTRKGCRPSFDNAMKPDEAKIMYERFIEYLKENSDLIVKTGVFGAMMDIELINDGPVTFIIEKNHAEVN